MAYYRYLESCPTEKGDGKIVHSIGHEVFWPPKDKPPRMIGRYVLHYIMKGSGTFNSSPIHADQFCMATPYDGHTIRQDAGDPLEFYYICIGGQDTDQAFQSAGLFFGFYGSEFSFCG